MLFTTAFFGVSLISSAVMYLIFTFYVAPSSEDKPRPRQAIKSESQDFDSKPFNPLSISDMSDTTRTFPTRGRQKPLQFTGPEEERKVKTEEEEDAEQNIEIQRLVAEADDEDEGYAGSSTWRDSGIGTGIDEDRRSAQRRRRSSREP